MARKPRTLLRLNQLQMRLMEKRRELVRQADVDALIDDIAGVTLPSRAVKRDANPAL